MPEAIHVERGKVYSLRQAIFTLPDGTQVLVDLWYADGVLESTSLATRPQRGDVWGPPVEGEWA